MRTRAFRRHQSNRLFQKALSIFKNRYSDIENVIDYARKEKDNLQSCSCWMCGSPRKHFKKKTIQELKAEEIIY